MSLLAAFEVASTDLVLGPTLAALPAVTVDLERQYALDPARPIAFCWIHADDWDRLEQTLTDDPTVDAHERLSDPDRWSLYRIRRSATDVVPAYREWVAAGGQLLDCRGRDGVWTVEMRFPDRSSFTAYHDFLEREGVSLELQRLADDASGRRHGGETVTPSQREALALAHQHGFFAVPRETTLSRVAETLDISTQAVSERLRRGHARLIDEHVGSE